MSLQSYKQIARIEDDDEASGSDSDDDPDVSKLPMPQEPPRSSASFVDWKGFADYKKKRFCSFNYSMMCEVENRIWNGTLDGQDLLFLQKLGFLKA